MIEFNFSVAPQSDSVVVLGGGISTKLNALLLEKYVRENHSIVFSSNYEYPFIKTDYILLGDARRFVKRISFIKNTKNIIICGDIKTSIIAKRGGEFFKKLWKKILSKYIIYKIGNGKKKDSFSLPKWDIAKNGSLKFCPTPGGCAAMSAAIMCNPKKILIAGMDGPDHPYAGKKITKKKYSVVSGAWIDFKYKSFDMYKKKRRNHEKLMIPLLKRRGIEIYCVKDSALWGINKSKYNIYEV